MATLNQYAKSPARKKRGSDPAARLRKMHDRLAAAYGPQHWWPAETAFEVILGAYLTQNTAWKAVERSLENLRAAGALSIAGLRAISEEKLRALIRPSGFITRKAPALKAFVAMLDAEFGGRLDRLAAAPTAHLRHRLLALPGVGEETADAILLYALGHSVPVADEYLRRIAERHRLLEAGARRPRYHALTDLTQRAFSSDPAASQTQLFNEFHALTVAVGKAHCGRTPRCQGCPLEYDLHSPTRTRRKHSELPQAERKRAGLGNGKLEREDRSQLDSRHRASAACQSEPRTTRRR